MQASHPNNPYNPAYFGLWFSSICNSFFTFFNINIWHFKLSWQPLNSTRVKTVNNIIIMYTIVAHRQMNNHSPSIKVHSTLNTTIQLYPKPHNFSSKHPSKTTSMKSHTDSVEGVFIYPKVSPISPWFLNQMSIVL